MTDPSVHTFSLDEWALIELTGDDRLGWLQGQATNDVRGLTPGTSLSFCLCEPTGHLIAVIDAWAVANRILLTTIRERLGAVLERIERMTILEDIAACELTSDYAGITFQGADADGTVGRSLALPEGEGGEVYAESIGSTAFLLRSIRTLGGWDVWISNSAQVTRESLGIGAPTLSSDEREAFRISAGIPVWGKDMGLRTLPPELGPDFESRHISYTKGCYTGQEVLMRMHSRGHTNRTWVGLVGDAPMEIGAAVVSEGKEVGRVSSASAHPHLEGKQTYAAAATLRNEAIAEGTLVAIGEGRAEVRRMPILRTT